jgi:hypothetical protein
MRSVQWDSTGFEIADAQVGAGLLLPPAASGPASTSPLTVATDPVVVPVQVGCVAGITSTDGCFSCRPDCVAVLVVDVVVWSLIFGSDLTFTPEEICVFLSRLVASQIATLPTPFAYLTLRTVLPVRNGIQPEAHSPTRYVSSDG